MQLFSQLSKLQGTTSYFDENVGRVGVKSDTVLPRYYLSDLSKSESTYQFSALCAICTSLCINHSRI